MNSSCEKTNTVQPENLTGIKFGSLAVGIDTAKLKSANNIFAGDHNVNDVILQ